MKANELMIGDWVYFGARAVEKEEDVLQLLKIDHTIPVIVETKNTPVMVVGISENTLDFSGLGQKVICVPYEMIEPIPLTPEILEKNGFHNEDDCWLSDDYSYGVDNQQGLMEFFKYETHEEDSKLEAQIPRCYYVHELQHALRKCGLNELEDNLKI